MDKLVILGGGESGVGSAVLAKVEGYEVFLSDSGSIKENYRQELKDFGIEFEEGGHSESRILAADEVMKSPGIPHKNEMVKKLIG
jgi:UDP-N-acetylmuramoylalanine--D-glutamate ligase